MRITRVGLCLLLLPALAWAGTWRDDFEDGDLNGWKVVTGNWKVIDGHLFCRQAASLSIGNDTWKDHSIECDVRIVSDFPALGFRYIGINPRNIAFGTGLSMLLSRSWNGRQGINLELRVDEYIQDKVKEIASKIGVSAEKLINQWFRERIEAYAA